MSHLSTKFKFVALALLVVFMLGFTQAHQPAMQPEQIHDAQRISFDATDDKQLNFYNINEDLDYLFLVSLEQDNKNIHVIVNAVDYSIPYSTNISLYIADDTQVTRELESQINRELTAYFEDKQIQNFKEF